MKKIFPLLMILAAMGCGSDNSLEAKKEALAEKKKAFSALKMEIEALEKEINSVDSTATEDLGAPVKLEMVERKNLSNPFQLQGLVASDRNVLVSAEMGGTITRIHVKDGQMVQKGQLIATLDGSTVGSQIAELQKALELAKTTFEKQESLWKQQIGTEMQYLQAKNRKESLEKSLATAQVQLGKFVLRAPISGIVDQLFKNEGEILGPGNPVARVVDASSVKIKADVSESYLKNIKPGSEVEVYYPSINVRAKEKVNAVGNYINPDNRTFSVYIIPSKGANELKPNMLAIITAYIFLKSDVISVPTRLIRNDGNGDYILTAKKDKEGKLKVAKTEIQVNEKFAGRSVVNSGLEIGDQIIVEGYQSVVAGDNIKEIR